MKSGSIKDTQGMLRQLSQHPVLPVIVGAPHISIRAPEGEATPRRLSAYLFFYMLDGGSEHQVDMDTVRLGPGQVLFVQPNQIHQFLSGWRESRAWYKIAFDEHCLALLPRTFDFLFNPLENPIVSMGGGAGERLTHAFEALAQLLPGPTASTELVLAHLNVLLSELNDSYFGRAEGGKLGVYLAFKALVEREFRSQPPIRSMARALSLSDSRLYAVVRRFAGMSPKAFLERRTILEAQRIFYYDRLPVKEVAYELGFSDPDHFSKVFKRFTGRTVTQFRDLYGK